MLTSERIKKVMTCENSSISYADSDRCVAGGLLATPYKKLIIMVAGWLCKNNTTTTFNDRGERI